MTLEGPMAERTAEARAVSGLLSTASALEGAWHSAARLPGVRESGATEFTAGSLLPSRREIAAGPCPTVLEVLLIE